MQRHSLAPPRRIDARIVSDGDEIPVVLPDVSPAPARSLPNTESALPPARESLQGPNPAYQQRRHLFNPRRGWFRRLERTVSQLLARHVFPVVPAMSIPYSYLLSNRLTLSEGRIHLPELPRAFDGLRVMLISDVHAGPFVSRRCLEETLGRLQSLQPDLIVLAGDLTTSRMVEYSQNERAFRTLHAPLGVYAVLGNHDHYSGEAGKLTELIERSGIQVLHNRSIGLKRGGATLSLAGVDDALMGTPDIQAALRDTCSPVILVSHNPDLFFEAAKQGVALMLSGHTHGGQIRIPGLGVLVRQSKYRLDEGRYRTGETELIVSRGLGAVGLPWRAACPPEAVLLTLTR
jgi:predicted MPP superfamily phosphohydrolase